jgi:hypothetical protein
MHQPPLQLFFALIVVVAFAYCFGRLNYAAIRAKLCHRWHMFYCGLSRGRFVVGLAIDVRRVHLLFCVSHAAVIADCYAAVSSLAVKRIDGVQGNCSSTQDQPQDDAQGNADH